MSVRIVRLGSPRGRDEGLRLGTVRHPPRGVPKGDLANRDWYDAWLPELAPSAPLVKQALGATTEREWAAFVRRYRAEMKAPEKRHLLGFLAALSHRLDFSVGCYCEDASRCHRSILAELLADHGARVA